MKRFDFGNIAPVLATVAGIAAMFIRKGLYSTAVDITGRVTAGHPLSWLLAGLTAAVVLLCLYAAWKDQEKTGPEKGANTNFCAGCCFFAFGIVFTVLIHEPPMPGKLGLAWRWLGCFSAPCLVWMGWRRLLGEKPPVLTCIVPTVFLTVHLINHYQLWCSNPQLLDVFFPLFATIALTITAYQQAAFAAELGSRRQLQLAGLLAIYLCFAELGAYQYHLLYLTGAIWATHSLDGWKAV